MKVVDVDDVLKILYEYGCKYVYVTENKQYSDMIDKVANLKGAADALLELIIKSNSNTTDILKKIEADIGKIPTEPYATAYTAKHEALKIIDKYMEEMEDGKA